MSSGLWPIEINCDAPPYAVVRSCAKIGFCSPLDVRWCRLSRLIDEHSGGQPALWQQPWMALLGLGQPWSPCCPCGHELPCPMRVEFTSRRKDAEYLLVQCPKCLTMCWDEV
jgi:hypothetical protein